MVGRYMMTIVCSMQCAVGKQPVNHHYCPSFEQGLPLLKEDLSCYCILPTSELVYCLLSILESRLTNALSTFGSFTDTVSTSLPVTLASSFTFVSDSLGDTRSIFDRIIISDFLPRPCPNDSISLCTSPYAARGSS